MKSASANLEFLLRWLYLPSLLVVLTYVVFWGNRNRDVKRSDPDIRFPAVLETCHRRGHKRYNSIYLGFVNCSRAKWFCHRPSLVSRPHSPASRPLLRRDIYLGSRQTRATSFSYSDPHARTNLHLPSRRSYHWHTDLTRRLPGSATWGVCLGRWHRDGVCAYFE